MCLVRFLSCGVCVYCWRNLIGHMHAALVWSAFLENLRPSPLAHGKGIIRFWDRGPWFRASSPHWKNRCEALSSVLLLALVFTLVYRQVPGGSRRTAALALHIRPTLDSCEPTCYILQKQFGTWNKFDTSMFGTWNGHWCNFTLGCVRLRRPVWHSTCTASKHQHD